MCGKLARMNDRASAAVKAIGYYWPHDREAPRGADLFGVSVQILIGSDDDDHADSFDLIVCSPDWFAGKAKDSEWDGLASAGLTGMSDNVGTGAGFWFMPRWDQSEFEAAVQLVVDKSNPGPDWPTVAARIGRLIPWEFDYKYDDDVNRRSGLPSPWRE